MKTDRPQYVVCIRVGEAGDLELRKLYRVLTDEAAATRRFIRVVDESGEDYLYPSDWFVPVEVSEDAEAALAAASTASTPRSP
jgi:hypothetical protein